MPKYSELMKQYAEEFEARERRSREGAIEINSDADAKMEWGRLMEWVAEEVYESGVMLQKGREAGDHQVINASLAALYMLSESAGSTHYEFIKLTRPGLTRDVSAACERIRKILTDG